METLVYDLITGHLNSGGVFATPLAVEGHLALNHLPFALLLIGIGFLTIGLAKKKDDFIPIGFGLFGIAAVLTVPVFLLGHLSHEAVENIVGIEGKFVEPHETFGLISLIGMLLLLAYLTFGHFRYGPKNIPKSFITMATLAAFLLLASLAYTQKLGGLIRHTELRGTLPVIRENPGDMPTSERDLHNHNGSSADAEAEENGNHNR